MPVQNLFPDPDRMPKPYTEWRQSASRAPTERAWACPLQAMRTWRRRS